MNAMTPAAEAVIAKIVKLQNLAAKNDNEAEASAAMAMANKLLVEHNLDAATIERASGDTGKREKANVEGGFYQWQRELWESVAKLNFCTYWSQVYRSEPEFKYRRFEGLGGPLTRVHIRVRRRRHALIGRTVNVRATEVMARYLEAAIERLREHEADLRPAQAARPRRAHGGLDFLDGDRGSCPQRRRANDLRRAGA